MYKLVLTSYDAAKYNFESSGFQFSRSTKWKVAVIMTEIFKEGNSLKIENELTI